ncbi:MAG: hypothetical protein JWM68_4674 [Verrucomicrobiales bacterium]|nr:hypothetical protein [Verrucomicrobiales bacterium]
MDGGRALDPGDSIGAGRKLDHELFQHHIDGDVGGRAGSGGEWLGDPGFIRLRRHVAFKHCFWAGRGFGQWKQYCGGGNASGLDLKRRWDKLGFVSCSQYNVSRAAHRLFRRRESGRRGLVWQQSHLHLHQRRRGLDHQ